MADDLNYPACAVWQNRNLVNQLENPLVNKLFPYYVQQNGGSSASEWKSTKGGPGTGVGTFYARSPYIDYVDHLYTDETNGILFTPSSETEQRINFRQDRTKLVGPNPLNPIYTFRYTNSPKTTFSGAYPASQVLEELDLQFNAGFGWSGSAFPGRKLINPNSNNSGGVGAVRVFNETNPIQYPIVEDTTMEELNINQSYPITGTLRIKLN